MFKLKNSAVILLESLLQEKGPQEFGSWFQDAVQHSLSTMDACRGCYENLGAGQPDVIAGQTGFEIKTTSDGSVALAGNYQEIRRQYPIFKLVGLRTDVKPYPLWVLEIPPNPPSRVTFKRVMNESTPIDRTLNEELAHRLSALLAAAGTSWGGAMDRKAANAALNRVVASGFAEIAE